MPIKSDREYRNLGTMSVEESDEVIGYATTFDRYLLWADDEITLYEQVDRNAFDGADMSDVVFLRDHSGAVLARTKNGSVNLSVDDHGLLTRTNLGLTEASRAMRDDIRVGNYSQMSFSFVIDKDNYEWIDDRTAVRHIQAFRKLYDISAVAFPANPYTEIGVSARSLLNGAIEIRDAERRLREQRQREIERLALRVKLMRGE